MIKTKEQLIEYRNRKGWTQQELASKIHLSLDYIQKIERGAKPVSQCLINSIEAIEKERNILNVVISEDDEKNMKKAIKNLKAYGDKYKECMDLIAETKSEMKDIEESAKGEGITKKMLMSYCTVSGFQDLTKKVIFKAVEDEK